MHYQLPHQTLCFLDIHLWYFWQVLCLCVCADVLITLVNLNVCYGCLSVLSRSKKNFMAQLNIVLEITEGYLV